MPSRHKIADVEDMSEEGSRLLIEVKGVEIAVFNCGDEYQAVANFCPHQGGPLCEGPLRGRTTVGRDGEWEYDAEQKHIVCPWHGWMFDITTGMNVDAERYEVPTYDVEVDDGELFVVG